MALIVFPLLAATLLPPQLDLWLGRVMLLVFSFSVVIWTVDKVRTGKFKKETDLPLDVCNLLGLTGVFLMWWPTIAVFEPMYYVILLGTLQGIFTPDFREDLTRLTYIRYWLVHSGLVVYVVYALVAYQFRPTLSGIISTFWVMQVYLIIAFIANWLVGGNYVYLRNPPSTRTILDYLGPWPIYIFSVNLLAVVGYYVIYWVTTLFV